MDYVYWFWMLRIGSAVVVADQRIHAGNVRQRQNAVNILRQRADARGIDVVDLAAVVEGLAGIFIGRGLPVVSGS